MWICHACGELVLDGEGYLSVMERQALVAAEVREAWDREHESQLTAIGEVLTKPPEVKLEVLHRRCVQNDEACYAIDVELIRSAIDALAWTRNLMVKTWIGSTNWGSLMGEIAKAGGSRLTP